MLVDCDHIVQQKVEMGTWQHRLVSWLIYKFVGVVRGRIINIRLCGEKQLITILLPAWWNWSLNWFVSVGGLWLIGWALYVGDWIWRRKCSRCALDEQVGLSAVLVKLAAPTSRLPDWHWHWLATAHSHLMHQTEPVTLPVNIVD